MTLQIYDIVIDMMRDCTERDLELLQLASTILMRVWIAEGQCEDYDSLKDSLVSLHQEFRDRSARILHEWPVKEQDDEPAQSS